MNESPVGDDKRVRPSDRLLNVQAMRACAAIMVTWLHSQAAISELARAKGESIKQFTPIDLSYGVDIFFVISGFVIAISSQILLRDRRGFEFFRKRIVRVAPSYWFFTLLLVAMTLSASLFKHVDRSDQILDLKNILCSLIFIPTDTYAYGVDAPLPILFVGWTLNFEMLFYLIFGACIFIGGRLSVASLRAAMAIGVLVAIGTLAPNLKLPWLFWSSPITLEFVAGLLLANLYCRGVRIPPLAQALLAALGLATWLVLKQSYFTHSPPNPHVTMGWPRVFTGGVGAVLIMSAAILGKWEVHGAAGRILARLGDGSYTLYLLHPNMNLVFAFCAERFWAPHHWIAGHIILLLVLSIAAAQLFYEVFERPAVYFIDKATKRRARDPLYGSG